MRVFFVRYYEVMAIFWWRFSGRSIAAGVWLRLGFVLVINLVCSMSGGPDETQLLLARKMLEWDSSMIHVLRIELRH